MDGEARRLLKPDGSAIINISPHVKNGILSDYVLHMRLALRGDGWAELGELVWSKTNSMPTGVPHRPRRSWESLLWYGHHGRAWSDAKAAGEPHKLGDFNGFRKTSGDKVSNASKRNGWNHAGGNGSTPPTGNARTRDVFDLSVNGTGNRVNHPAPQPWRLSEWCGKLICPPGGTILDPFSGSGSTGVAAIRNDWDYIGIDAVEEYVDMSRKRLSQEVFDFGAIV